MPEWHRESSGQHTEDYRPSGINIAFSVIFNTDVLRPCKISPHAGLNPALSDSQVRFDTCEISALQRPEMEKQDRQCTYNVTLTSVRVTNVAVEKQ